MQGHVNEGGDGVTPRKDKGRVAREAATEPLVETKKGGGVGARLGTTREDGAKKKGRKGLFLQAERPNTALRTGEGVKRGGGL